MSGGHARDVSWIQVEIGNKTYPSTSLYELKTCARVSDLATESSLELG